MERAMGIEPTSEAWEASILPLYDARSFRTPAIIPDNFSRSIAASRQADLRKNNLSFMESTAVGLILFSIATNTKLSLLPISRVWLPAFPFCDTIWRWVFCGGFTLDGIRRPHD